MEAQKTITIAHDVSPHKIFDYLEMQTISMKIGYNFCHGAKMQMADNFLRLSNI